MIVHETKTCGQPHHHLQISKIAAVVVPLGSERGTTIVQYRGRSGGLHGRGGGLRF
jgi:hypothetical protein